MVTTPTTGLPSEIFKNVTALEFMKGSIANGLTALVGGGQSAVSALTTMFNRFSGVASATDSATLPNTADAVGGKFVVVSNGHATNSMNVFPFTGDAINALSVNAAFAVAAGKTVLFIAVGPGLWVTILTA